MTPRTKNILWFAIPTLATAAALTAISLSGGGLEETQEAVGSTNLAEPIIALILFAAAGGAAVGGVVYGIRRLSTKKPVDS